MHDENNQDSFIEWLLSRDDLCDEEKTSICVTLLNAAIDTTSNSTTMNLYNLATNPEVRNDFGSKP